MWFNSGCTPSSVVKTLSMASCLLEAFCTSWLSWCYVYDLDGWVFDIIGSSWACVSALSPQVEKWLQSQTTWWGWAAGEVWGGGGRGKPWKTLSRVMKEALAKHNNVRPLLVLLSFIWSHCIMCFIYLFQDHVKTICSIWNAPLFDLGSLQYKVSLRLCDLCSWQQL